MADLVHRSADALVMCGDGRDVIPSTAGKLRASGKTVLLLTDPPYGINVVGGDGKIGSGGRTYKEVLGDREPFNPKWLLDLGLPSVIWGANHFCHHLPGSPCWLVWDKRESNDFVLDFADCEIAWTNLPWPARVFRYRWSGFSSRRSHVETRRFHPTQKPVELMLWAIQQAEKSLKTSVDVIIDPYMGSGSALAAAVTLHKKCVGVDLDREYCDGVVRRLASLQTVLPGCFGKSY